MRILPLGLIALILCLGAPGAQVSGQAAPQRAFLPLVHSSSPVQVEWTSMSPVVRGYLRAPPGAPLARITLAVDVQHYQRTDQFIPVFAVTLPGQPNPFSYWVGHGKGYSPLSNLRIVEIAPVGTDERYYPLTVISWGRVGTELSGMLRNDSPEVLHNLRAGVFGGTCWWWPIPLSVATLQPGQTVAFQLSYPCDRADTIDILGQGAAP